MKKLKLLPVLCLLALLLALLTEAVITDRDTGSIQRKQEGTVVSLLEQAELTYADYDDYFYSSPKALPRTQIPDGLICLDFSPIEIGSVRILFDRPLEKGGYITFSYGNVPAVPETGLYDPFSAMRMVCKTGDTEFMVSLPEDEYSHLDFYISGNAEIADILISPLPLNVTRRTFILKEALVLFAIYAAVMSAIVFAVPKAAEFILSLLHAVRKWFSARYKRILKTAAVLIGCIGAGFAVEMFLDFAGSCFTPQRVVFFGGILFIIAELWLMRKECREKPEQVFLMLSLTIGTVIAFTGVNFPTSFDADAHYTQALYSSYLFSDEAIVTQADAHMINNGERYSDPDTSDGSKLAFRTDRTSGYLQKGRQSLENAYRSGNYYSVPVSFQMNQIVYIPYGIMLTLGRIMKLPFWLQYNFGKLGSLFIYSALMYAAVKRLTSRKMLFAVMALLPTPLYLVGNYSYDYMVMSGISLGFVYFIEEYKNPEKPLSLRSEVIMLLSFFFGMLHKAVYFPLLLLPLLLLPKSKFSKKHQRLIYALLTILAILVLFGNMFITFLASVPVSGGSTDIRGGDNVNSAAQIKYVLTHPFDYFTVLMRQILSLISYNSLLYCYLDFKTLGTDSGGMAVVTALLLCFLLLTELNDSESFHASRKLMLRLKICIAVFTAAAIVLIISAMYATFSNVGSPVVNGVQLRYFIPLLFPLTYLVQNTKKYIIVQKNYIKNVNLVVFAVTAFVNIFMLNELIISGIM